jgi:hypothetical protein
MAKVSALVTDSAGEQSTTGGRESVSQLTKKIANASKSRFMLFNHELMGAARLRKQWDSNGDGPAHYPFHRIAEAKMRSAFHESRSLKTHRTCR